MLDIQEIQTKLGRCHKFQLYKTNNLYLRRF